MTTSSNAWPTFESTSNNAIGQHQNIRWETVKTEEEEYLDKLQSKLARVMSAGFQSSKPDSGDRLGLDQDGLHDEQVAMPIPLDDDEGLHLLYDEPLPLDTARDTAADPSLPSTSTRTIDSETLKDDAEADVQKGLEKAVRQRTVRFRSRVRITSGVRSLSASSSVCGSAASSISVPLRGTESVSSNAVAAPSLSEMLPSDTTSAWLSGISAVRRERRRLNPPVPRSSTDERTPLMFSGVETYAAQPQPQWTTIGTSGRDDPDEELDRIRTAARKTEEQVVFGKWPWRLLNGHWWWWKIEPLICCCDRFEDESDDG